MISCCMPLSRKIPLLLSQKFATIQAIASIDSSWAHGKIVLDYLGDLERIIDGLLPVDIQGNENLKIEYNRKRDKYTNWAEVMRLALFQYERFAPNGFALSDGLYSSLVAAAAIWGRGEVKSISILGCGPGRTVLDFSRLFPSCEIVGVDYSLFSLMLAERIICGEESVPILKRDVSSDDYSEVLMIPGMKRRNVSFECMDLDTDELPEADIVVCSNIINLLSNHREIIYKIYHSVHSGGLVIFADLLGWRLDRNKGQKGICTKDNVEFLFQEAGFSTLECYSGVPYIESESADQYTFYKEHIYIGRKPL